MITVISGPPESGKTWTAWSIIQQMDYIALEIDEQQLYSEFVFDCLEDYHNCVFIDECVNFDETTSFFIDKKLKVDYRAKDSKVVDMPDCIICTDLFIPEEKKREGVIYVHLPS